MEERFVDQNKNHKAIIPMSEYYYLEELKKLVTQYRNFKQSKIKSNEIAASKQECWYNIEYVIECLERIY
jgi:hypothetical protein